MVRVCVYTGIYGRYDTPRKHVPQTHPCDFFYFGDSGTEHPYDPVPALIAPTLRAIWVRLHPFSNPYLYNYDLIIYCDGNVTITNPNFVQDLIDKYRVTDYSLTLTRHPDRTCAYKEAEYSKANFKKYETIDLDKQVDKYRQEGFPENYGLYWNGLMVFNSRGAQYPLLERFLWSWYEEMMKYHKTSHPFPQGQVSLPYVLWKTQIKFQVLPSQNTFGGEYVKIDYHSPF
jgi:hypothetical protein